MTFEVNQRVKCILWNGYKWSNKTHTGTVVVPKTEDGYIIVQLDDFEAPFLHFLPEQVEALTNE